MKWLAKYFKMQRTSNNEVDNDTNISEDLFVDQEQPTELSSDHQTANFKVPEFLNQDFQKIGYQEGYTYHNKDMILNKIQSIKAEFRLMVDMDCDRTRREILEIRNNMADIDGLSNRLTKQWENTLSDKYNRVDELTHQKQLSVDDEGWVMQLILKYRDGYIRGTEVFHEEKRLGMSTGLFNDDLTFKF